MPLPIQGECKRLTCSMQELKTKLNESTMHIEVLEAQLDEEAEKYRLMEVPLSYTSFHLYQLLHHTYT